MSHLPSFVDELLGGGGCHGVFDGSAMEVLAKLNNLTNATAGDPETVQADLLKSILLLRKEYAGTRKIKRKSIMCGLHGLMIANDRVVSLAHALTRKLSEMRFSNGYFSSDPHTSLQTDCFSTTLDVLTRAQRLYAAELAYVESNPELGKNTLLNSDDELIKFLNVDVTCTPSVRQLLQLSFSKFGVQVLSIASYLQAIRQNFNEAHKLLLDAFESCKACITEHHEFSEFDSVVDSGISILECSPEVDDSFGKMLLKWVQVVWQQNDTSKYVTTYFMAKASIIKALLALRSDSGHHLATQHARDAWNSLERIENKFDSSRSLCPVRTSFSGVTMSPAQMAMGFTLQIQQNICIMREKRVFAEMLMVLKTGDYSKDLLSTWLETLSRLVEIFEHSLTLTSRLLLSESNQVLYKQRLQHYAHLRHIASMCRTEDDLKSFVASISPSELRVLEERHAERIQHTASFTAPQCSAGCGARETASLKFKVCSRCRVAKYCSTACQRTHWTEGHKSDCKKLCAPAALVEASS